MSQQRDNRHDKHSDQAHGHTPAGKADTRGLQQQMNLTAQQALQRQQQLNRSAQARTTPGISPDALSSGLTPGVQPNEIELRAAAQAQRDQGLAAKEIDVQNGRAESRVEGRDLPTSSGQELNPEQWSPGLDVLPTNADQIFQSSSSLSDAEYLALINQTFARFSAWRGTAPQDVDIRGFWDWLREMGAFGRPSGNRRISKSLQLDEELRFFMMMMTQILEWFLKVCAERGQPLPPSMQKIRQMVEYLKQADPDDPIIGHPAAGILFDEDGSAVKAVLKAGDDTAAILGLDLKKAGGQW